MPSIFVWIDKESREPKASFNEPRAGDLSFYGDVIEIEYEDGERPVLLVGGDELGINS